MQRVSSGVYVADGFRCGNIGLILTAEGAVVIDTPMLQSEVERFRAEMAGLTDKEVIFVVNTDHHKERVLGNWLFPEAAVISHELALQEMKNYTEAWLQRLLETARESDPEMAEGLIGLTPVLPEITFNRKMTLHLGDKVLHLFHVGGHTPGSIMVYDADSRVLFTGDVVVNKMHPVLGQANSSEWLEALGRIRKLKVDRLVPGQGEVCGKEAIQEIANYLQSLRSGVQRLYNAGYSRGEVVSELMNMIDFFSVPAGERSRVERELKAGMARLYDELKAD